MGVHRDLGARGGRTGSVRGEPQRVAVCWRELGGQHALEGRGQEHQRADLLARLPIKGALCDLMGDFLEDAAAAVAGLLWCAYRESGGQSTAVLCR